MSYRILTIEKEGELPRERECVDDFTAARARADEYVANGKYAAGVKLISSGRAVDAWRYLTSINHGPTKPELAERRRRKQHNPVLPMSGNPVT